MSPSLKEKEIKTFETSKVLCHVNLTYDELLETYMLPDAEEQFITQELKNVKNVSLNREMLFDRRFTETVASLPVSANGARWSTRIRTITCHLHAKLFKSFALVIALVATFKLVAFIIENVLYGVQNTEINSLYIV